MKNKQIWGGALLSYSTILFNVLSGLLYTPWMIHTIGNDQYALYTLAISVINIFLLDFGIGASITKFLSNYYASGQQEEANRFMGIVYKVFFIITLVIALGLAFFYFFIDRVYLKLTPEELDIFKHLYLIVATYSVISFPCIPFKGILMANEKFIELKACTLLEKVLCVAMIIIFLLMGKGVYSLVLVHAFSSLLFSALRYFFVRKKTKQRSQICYWEKGMAMSLFNFSIWVTISNIAQRLIYNIMPSLIAATINSSAVTLFSLAAIIEGYVYTFADAINGMFMPKVSRLLTQKNKEAELTSLMIKVGKFQVYAIGLLYLGFLIIGKEFIFLWMGPGYELVYYCAVILILPSLIDYPQQIAKISLTLTDIVKEQALIYGAMAAINLLLAASLMPVLGIQGAAISVCVAYLVDIAAFNVLYCKRLPVNLRAYFVSVYPRWFLVAGLSFGWGLAVNAFPLSGWIGLLVKGILIFVFYISLTFWIGLARSERHHIISLVRNKVHRTHGQ